MKRLSAILMVLLPALLPPNEPITRPVGPVLVAIGLVLVVLTIARRPHLAADRL